MKFPLKYLWSLDRKLSFQLFVTLLLASVVHGSLLLVWAKILGVLFNSPSLGFFSALAASILLLASIKAFFRYRIDLLQTRMASLWAHVYRRNLLGDILHKDHRLVHGVSPALWMTEIIQGVEKLQNHSVALLHGLLRGSLNLMAGLGASLYLSPKAGSFFLLLAPFIAWGMGKTAKKVSFHASNYKKDQIFMSEFLWDMRKNLEIIQAESREEFVVKQFDNFQNSYLQRRKVATRLKASFAPLMEALGISLLAGLVWSIQKSWIVPLGSGSLGFLIAIGSCIKPLKELGEQLLVWKETETILGKALFEKKNFLTKHEAQSPQNLQLEYLSCGPINPREKDFFSGGGIQWNQGEFIVVVGPNGGGKSSLAKTLVGLVPPRSWKGQPSWEAWYPHVAYVSQKPFLFTGTVKDNLLYGLKDQCLSSKDLKNVLEMVELDSLCLDRPLQTLNLGVSGGQKQRLVLARALLSQKPFWILDEVTSELDKDTEKKIWNLLRQWNQEKKVGIFIVTHRVDPVEDHDQVWWIEDRKLKWVDSHKSLKKREDYEMFFGMDTQNSQVVVPPT